MIIGLHGRNGAGKDTVCERLRTMTEVTRVSLADNIYASAAAALGVEPEVLRRGKNQPRASVTLTLESPDGQPYIRADISVRWFLQLYGAEAHRDLFGEDFWVDKIDLTHNLGHAVVVTDVRFPNDARYLREHGGYIYRVIGPPEIEDPEPQHVSDLRLPPELLDGEIDNSLRGDNFHGLDRQLHEVLETVRHGVAVPVE